MVRYRCVCRVKIDLEDVLVIDVLGELDRPEDDAKAEFWDEVEDAAWDAIECRCKKA